MEDKDIDKLKEMPLISRYLSEKILDIEKYNASIGGEKERRRAYQPRNFESVPS